MTTVTAVNGVMPDELLAVVDTGPNGPQRLAVAVAPIWAAMLAAGMPPGCLRSGYRSLAQQAGEVAAAAAGQTPSALPPGTSKHGLGLAADIDEPARSWARAHASTYGLRFPIANEPWHGELDQAHLPPAPDPHTTLTEDSAMKLIRVKDDGRIFVVDAFTFDQLTDMDHVNALLPLTGPWLDVDVVTAQRLHDVVNQHLVNLAASLKGQGL